jgi:hypothetical protein
MQKINFLPQVKAWNAIEFGARNTWTLTRDEVGMMTYDASINTTGDGGGTFMVSVPGKTGARWAALLVTGEDNTSFDTTYMKSLYLHNKTDNTYITFSGDASVYTQSKYNASTNPLATMADVQASISGSTILGATMDGNSVVDSSIAKLYSDPSSLYNASTNQLATIGTVENAIAAIGTVLELRRVYDPNNIPVETPETITEFSDWLAYCNSSASGTPSWDYYLHDENNQWNVKKGNVVIWGNKEYVYTGVNPGEAGYDPSDMDNWELFGTLDINNAVISFGGATGVIDIDSSSFYMNSSTLKLQVADTTHLGGVMTGFEYTHRDASLEIGTPSEHSQRYGEFGLDVSSLNGTHKAYTDVPFQTGHVEAGLLTLNDYQLLQSYESNGVFVAAALIDESSVDNNVNYRNVYRVEIAHNFNQAAIQISVYKNLEYGRDGSNNPKVDTISKQMVYADEIIADSSTVRIDFGSPQAFIGCQDSSNDRYFGYTVVMTIPHTPVIVPDASVTGVEHVI